MPLLQILRFSNLGDKIFETDFKSPGKVLKSVMPESSV